mgnify:FL=1
MSAKRTVESFWARVDIRSLDECWEWQGSCNNSGYGTVRWKGVTCCAHRVAAELFGFVEQAPAPTNRTISGFILHQCDNPPCCNPTHWKIGTYTENQLEAYARNRRAQPKGHLHANAKLSPKQVVWARTRAGVDRQADTARILGVSQRAVCLIQRGETYRNVR